MLPMIVADNTVFLFIRTDESFLLKLIPVPEAHEPPLGKAEEVNSAEVVLQFKGQMLLFILVLVKLMHVLIVNCSTLSLD